MTNGWNEMTSGNLTSTGNPSGPHSRSSAISGKRATPVLTLDFMCR